VSEKPYHIEQDTQASLHAKIVDQHGNIFMTCDAHDAEFGCAVANTAYLAGKAAGEELERIRSLLVINRVQTFMLGGCSREDVNRTIDAALSRSGGRG
jgi:hypothetical protein